MPVNRTGPGFKELKEQADSLKNMVLQVGYFASNIYPNGEPVAYIAAIQEFGYKWIPPRPFFRPTITNEKEKWKRLAGFLSARILSGKLDVEGALEIMGQTVSGDIRDTVRGIWEPPLAPITIQNRLKNYKKKIIGNLNKPLVHTGILLNTITYIVMKGEEVQPYKGNGA